MARKKRSKELQPNIKVRLDRRTIITVRDRSKLDFWREKYPNLEILEESYDKVEQIPEVPSRRRSAAKKPAATKSAKKPAEKKPAEKKPVATKSAKKPVATKSATKSVKKPAAKK